MSQPPLQPAQYDWGSLHMNKMAAKCLKTLLFEFCGKWLAKDTTQAKVWPSYLCSLNGLGSSPSENEIQWNLKMWTP